VEGIMAHPDQPNIRLGKEVKSAAKYEYGKFGLNENSEPFVRIDQDEIGITHELTYVQDGDSAGRVSTIKRYVTDYTSTDKAKLWTFEYGDVNYPLSPTKIVVSLVDI
jgi:hypothetical protein